MGQKIIPVEVKYRHLKKPEVRRSLRSFINKYQPETAWVINLGFQKEMKLDKTDIRFLPFWEVGTEKWLFSKKCPGCDRIWQTHVICCLRRWWILPPVRWAHSTHTDEHGQKRFWIPPVRQKADGIITGRGSFFWEISTRCRMFRVAHEIDTSSIWVPGMKEGWGPWIWRGTCSRRYSRENLLAEGFNGYGVLCDKNNYWLSKLSG